MNMNYKFLFYVTGFMWFYVKILKYNDYFCDAKLNFSEKY